MRYLIFLFTVSCFAQSEGLRYSIQSQAASVGVAETLVTESLAADEYGFRVWSWEDTTLPNTDNDGSVYFDDNHLKTSFECSPDRVTKVSGENKLRCYLDPVSPAPSGWCANSYNMRAEIGTQPANVQLASGTEEWIGFSYGFGSGYVADDESKWLLWQNYNTVAAGSPLLSLMVNAYNSSFLTGELVIVNASQTSGSNSYYGTGIVPVADQTIDIVIHLIWGDEANGLIELWIDDVQEVDQQVRTIRSGTNAGGHDKWGQYCTDWRNGSNVSASAADGITDRETFLGPIRMIIRGPGDPSIGLDETSDRNLVKPQ